MYVNRKNNQCMLSSTARLFMAIMIYNVIQVVRNPFPHIHIHKYLLTYIPCGQVVTFHGGMVALAYEWGSANHMAPKDTSPDDLANLDMAIFMKAFGGQFKKEKPYPSERFVFSCVKYGSMYVCMYVCMYAITSLPVYVSMYVCVYVYILYVKRMPTQHMHIHTLLRLKCANFQSAA